jgi:HAD superfamily hydrolase (TIGR01484 family)
MPQAAKLLAFDYDWTIAEDGRIPQPVDQALRDARAAGLRLALVTGRFVEELLGLCPEQIPLFDVVFGENGGVRYVPEQRRIERMAPSPHVGFVTELIRREVVFFVGRVMVASRQPFDVPIREAAEQTAGDALRVLLNRRDVLALPRGVDKGAALQQALSALEIDPSAVIAFGDGHNDLDLLNAAGTGVAVGNAVEELKDAADYVTEQPYGAGVVDYLREFVLT